MASGNLVLDEVNPKNSKVNANIDLPPQNPFIPNNLTLLNNVAVQDKVVPLCISNDDSSKVYFASDSKYLVPKIVTVSTIKSPLLDGSAKSIAFTDLYLKALKEQLSPITSFAESASLQSNLLQKFDT